ncbi:MAG TPA: SusC/RagA family TonB-linked outer membrane protein [Bacteroidales bacterium]|nr:SusC/RagA family TonB-linked outer membrane protein [Bacteroidales bacterium]
MFTLFGFCIVLFSENLYNTNSPFMRKFYTLLILFALSSAMFAQNRTVTGKVTDATDGSGIPGATISQKGTSNGTITDLTGKYTLQVPENATLVVSFVGMKTVEIAVGTSTVIDVKMEPGDLNIEEVVVVGYGVQKKSLITGSIAKVDGENIARAGNLRVNQALQGKTAGVVITNNSGQPGDQVSVRIRGVGTNGDAEPLYIVDGMPMNGYGIDFLNASDVSSVEVLKDAAAAAIYGTRGANGVVLITTKKGNKNDKFSVSYDANYGVQNPWRKLDVLNKDEYIMMINEAAVNAGQSPKFSAADISTFKWDTDWQDEMFYYNAPKSNHVLSFEGGSEKATYSSSLSMFNQDGIVDKGHSNFNRITYRLNTTREFGALTIGSNLNLVQIKSRGISANDHFGAVSLVQALNNAPIMPVKFDNGTWATPQDFGIAMQEITNPVAMLSFLNSKTTTKKMVGNVYGEFNFGKLFKALEGLTFKSTYGMEMALVTNAGYTPKYYLDATHQSVIDKTNKSMDQHTSWNVENVLTYNKALGLHNITLLAGHAAFKYTYENVGGAKNDLIFDDFEHAYLDNATDPLSANAWGGYGENTLLSYFGRINYSLADKYMLTAILRTDGSSRFGSENKFGYFPSVSAGWILSKEDFFAGLTNVVNTMKIRASWGQNGSENIGNFRYTSVMSNGAIYYFGGNETQYNGMQPSRIANPSLKWETSEQTNLGLDMGFIQDRITLSLDYYIKTTKDWLVDAPLPMLVGNTPPTINGGSVQNSGLEFELGTKNKFGGLFAELSFTGSFNKNEVLDIQNEEKRIQGGDGGFGQGGILYAAVGTPMGVFYGIKTAGIFQNDAEVAAHKSSTGALIQPNAKPGDFRFVDFNEDGKIDDKDRQIIGNPYPKFTGGINLSLTWKGIDLSMQWYTALGQQIYDATRRYDMNFTNYRTEFLNRWTGEGSTNEYPRVTFADLNQNWKTPSDFYVKDADYIRLKNLNLGYTLPNSLTSKVRINKLRVYLSAENLLTFTKYKGFDPEIGGGVFNNGVDHGIYPQARTISGGINLTF